MHYVIHSKDQVAEKKKCTNVPIAKSVSCNSDCELGNKLEKLTSFRLAKGRGL